MKTGSEINMIKRASYSMYIRKNHAHLYIRAVKTMLKHLE